MSTPSIPKVSRQRNITSASQLKKEFIRRENDKEETDESCIQVYHIGKKWYVGSQPFRAETTWYVYNSRDNDFKAEHGSVIYRNGTVRNYKLFIPPELKQKFSSDCNHN